MRLFVRLIINLLASETRLASALLYWDVLMAVMSYHLRHAGLILLALNLCVILKLVKWL